MGGTPEQMADAYAASSVMAHVDGVQGALLLVHGLGGQMGQFNYEVVERLAADDGG